jgi:hypothetical protein
MHLVFLRLEGFLSEIVVRRGMISIYNWQGWGRRPWEDISAHFVRPLASLHTHEDRDGVGSERHTGRARCRDPAGRSLSDCSYRVTRLSGTNCGSRPGAEVPHMPGQLIRLPTIFAEA